MKPPDLLTLKIVHVVVPAVYGFDFLVPESLLETCTLGTLVEIKVGHKKQYGYVVKFLQESPYQLKPIVRVLQEAPKIAPDLVQLVLFVADYYMTTYAHTLSLVVPSAQRKKVLEKITLTKAGKALLKNLRKNDDVDLKQHPLIRTSGCRTSLSVQKKLHLSLSETQALLASLQQSQWISIQDQTNQSKINKSVLSDRLIYDNQRFESQAFVLNTAQKQVLDVIKQAYEQGRYHGFLLWGVTGSGKTEVYLHMIAHVLARGESALVLVPEIALTPQMQSRFESRFGDLVATLHSAVKTSEKKRLWQAIECGQKRVVVGPRSALFAPLQKLKLIIVDEAHDESYKQNETPRYHARDMALLRAQYTQSIAVLGSATPALESIYNAEQGKLTLLHMQQRAHAQATLPAVEIISLKDHQVSQKSYTKTGEYKGHFSSLLSYRMIEAIEQTLNKQEQVVLFLNRRGFSPFIICTSCGGSFHCYQCSVAMTHHLSRSILLCHYCGHEQDVPIECAQCHSHKLRTLGSGTEKLEIDLIKRFPEFNIARLDRDAVRHPQAMQDILERFRQGKIHILVGTQMVTKGHDFPKVTLVGVVMADFGLHFPDFRAAERTAQMLIQVAGRAGRSDDPGRVLIQTYHPDHPCIVAASTHHYANWVQHEIKERAALLYPPFNKLVLIRGECDDLPYLQTAIIQLTESLKRLLVSQPQVLVLGPSPCPIERIKGHYRMMLLVKAKTHQFMRKSIIKALSDYQSDKKIHWIIDVDPYAML